MNILIYSPNNQRAVDQQSQAILFKKMGHEPILLTWLPEGDLHKHFQKHGFKTYTTDVKGRGIVYLIRQVIFLINFCRRNNVGIVFSHLQTCGSISGIARFFMKTKVVYVRHHSDFVGLYNSYKERLQNWLANTLSPRIIAISDGVKKQLIKEGVGKEKIVRINLCYDFDEYVEDSSCSFEAVKRNIASDLTILYVARLDPVKRHTVAFDVIEQLVEKNINCKLICIGSGIIEKEIRSEVINRNLSDHIYILGFVTNVFDYIKAADLLLLLSDTEASSHMVKEAGFNKKTLIACKDVGDFNDYIVNGKNGYLVNKDNPVPETVAILEELYKKKEQLNALGSNLWETVGDNFCISDSFSNKYSALLEDLKVNSNS